MHWCCLGVRGCSPAPQATQAANLAYTLLHSLGPASGPQKHAQRSQIDKDVADKRAAQVWLGQAALIALPGGLQVRPQPWSKASRHGRGQQAEPTQGTCGEKGKGS